MEHSFTIWYVIIFAVLATAIIIFDLKYNLLRDQSSVQPRPYSFARVQLAWWTVIIISAFATIVVAAGEIPTLNNSTLILLGISTGTLAAGRIVDLSDIAKVDGARHQEQKSSGFFIDILSDSNGVSMHRFQAVAFNLIFGVWFIITVLEHGRTLPPISIHDIIPEIADNNLVLLGLSAATYSALKTGENKSIAVK